MTNLITPRELAEQHQISVKSIYRLVAQGKLRAVRLPGSRFIRFDPERLEPAPVAPRPVKLLSIKQGRSYRR